MTATDPLWWPIALPLMAAFALVLLCACLFCRPQREDGERVGGYEDREDAL